jgi:hypothetical protein
MERVGRRTCQYLFEESNSEDNVRQKRCSDSRHRKKSKKRMSASSGIDSSDNESKEDEKPMTD